MTHHFKFGDRVRDSVSGWTGVITLIGSSYYEGGLIQVEFENNKFVFVHVSQLTHVPDDEGKPTTKFNPLEDINKAGETVSNELSVSSFEQSVRRHTNRIANLLIEKNKQYSNSALDPIRVFSKADRTEQLRVRADDKLSRIRNGDTSEDALTDLAGYIILMKIAEESE